jgi:hypothetical protein
MQSIFYIVLNIRTGSGFECFGKFSIGNDKQHAYTIFDKLKGTRKVTDQSLLHLDLMETKQGLPVNVQVISCSLDELSENCRIITRETFKVYNLEV